MANPFLKLFYQMQRLHYNIEIKCFEITQIEWLELFEKVTNIQIIIIWVSKICTLGWSAKKKHLGFWPNSAELLGHYPRLPRKNLSSLGGGGGELETLKGQRCNLSFYTFLNHSQPPRIKTQTSTKGSKVADRKNREFLFFKKIELKGLVPQIRAQKNFLAQRSGFKPNRLDNFAQHCCQSHYKIENNALFHDKISQFGVLNYFPKWQHCNAKLFSHVDLHSLLWAKKNFWPCICGTRPFNCIFLKIKTRFLQSATFWLLVRGLSFDPRRLRVVQRGVETQIAPF